MLNLQTVLFSLSHLTFVGFSFLVTTIRISVCILKMVVKIKSNIVNKGLGQFLPRCWTKEDTKNDDKKA